MSYCETTAFEVVRVKSATPPRICGPAADAAVTGKFRSDARLSRAYCGVWMTIGYDTPFLGFNQYVGVTCPVPARLVPRLVVTSRSVTPTYWARERSTSTLKPGLARDC